ncbi:MAG: DMT family transporter [Magnetospirillum sp.]
MRNTMFMVALAAILWGANFNLSQLVVHEIHPLLAGAGRFVLAALVMLAVAGLWRHKVPFRKHWRAYFLLGLVGIGGFNLLFFMGMASTSAVNGSLIMATNPLVTSALAALFLGERLGRVQVMAMPVALAGVGVVVLGGGAGLHLAMGDAAMIGANLSWALYNVLARRLMPAESGVSNTAGIMSMGALVMAAGGLMVGAPVQMPSSQALGALAFMAVGGSALAYLLWNAGISRLGAARTSVFLNLVPVSTMSIAALAGHPPGATQLAGAFLVLAAVSAPLWWPKSRVVTA